MKVSRGRRKPLLMGFYDIRRAHFNGAAQRDIFVQLPPELQVEDMCAKLLKSMYGTQDAANRWQDDYIELFISHGFIAGISNRALL